MAADLNKIQACTFYDSCGCVINSIMFLSHLHFLKKWLDLMFTKVRRHGQLWPHSMSAEAQEKDLKERIQVRAKAHDHGK